MNFLKELHRRNPVLFWYGLLNFVAVAICIVLTLLTHTTVNGINAYIKPVKFFLSIGIFCFTMGWIMHYLEQPGKVRTYTIMAVTVLFYESFVITWQAANGRLSHYNRDTPLYAVLFAVMGVAIVFLTLCTGYIGFLFFKKKNLKIPAPYRLSIQLGILIFVVFALQGMVMSILFTHTIGGPDSATGLPFLNWKREHGDLRIAHFFGMHALQILPLFGCYVAKTPKSVKVFASIYTLTGTVLLVQALLGYPLM